MKTWWKNYKISCARDEHSGLAQREASRPGSAPEDEDFARALEHLDAQLRQPVPSPATPPGLHSSVMRSVRQASNRPQPESFLRPIYGLAFLRPALAMLAVAGLVWWFMPRVANRELVREEAPTSFVLATVSQNTLQAGKRMAQVGPAAVLGPLEREMALLESDVRKAAQFAIATLP